MSVNQMSVFIWRFVVFFPDIKFGYLQFNLAQNPALPGIIKLFVSNDRAKQETCLGVVSGTLRPLAMPS
jgi:hypothetical protein